MANLRDRTVNALNKLFPIATSSNTGAIIQLTPELLKALYPGAYAAAAVIGGGPFVGTVCNIVNLEVAGRTPDPSASNTIGSAVAKSNNSNNRLNQPNNTTSRDPAKL